MNCETFPERKVGAVVPDCNPTTSVHSVDFPELVRLHWGQVYRSMSSDHPERARRRRRGPGLLPARILPFASIPGQSSDQYLA